MSRQTSSTGFWTIAALAGAGIAVLGLLGYALGPNEPQTHRERSRGPSGGKQKQPSRGGHRGARGGHRGGPSVQRGAPRRKLGVSDEMLSAKEVEELCRKFEEEELDQFFSLQTLYQYAEEKNIISGGAPQWQKQIMKGIRLIRMLKKEEYDTSDEAERILSDLMRILDKGSVLAEEAVQQPERHIVDTLICVLKGLAYHASPETPSSIALESFRTAIDEWELWMAHANKNASKPAEEGQETAHTEGIDVTDPVQSSTQMILALLMVNVVRCMTPKTAFPVVKAIRYATQSVSILTQLTGASSNKTTSALDALAQLYLLNGELSRSEALLRDVLEKREATVDPSNHELYPLVFSSTMALCFTLMKQSRHHEIKELISEKVAQMLANSSPNTMYFLLETWFPTLWASKEFSIAVTLREEQLKLISANRAAFPATIVAHHYLLHGWALRRSGKIEDAITFLNRCDKSLDNVADEKFRLYVSLRISAFLADIHEELGENDDADELYNSAMETAMEIQDTSSGGPFVLMSYYRFLRACGRHEDAEDVGEAFPADIREMVDDPTFKFSLDALLPN